MDKRALVLAVVLAACGGEVACDEPPSGFYTLTLLEGEERSCTLETDPAVSHGGSLATFCDGCEASYRTRSDYPTEEVAAIYLGPEDDIYTEGTTKGGAFGLTGRVEVRGACGDPFVGEVRMWHGCVLSAGRPCTDPPVCVYALEIERL